LIVGTASVRPVPFVAGLLSSVVSAFRLPYRSHDGLGQRILFSRYKADSGGLASLLPVRAIFFCGFFYEDAARVF
jgi:hypothetical protein